MLISLSYKHLKLFKDCKNLLLVIISFIYQYNILKLKNVEEILTHINYANSNFRVNSEIKLEKELNTLCNNENCKKIKDLLNEVLNLSCIIEKSLKKYFNNINNNNSNNTSLSMYSTEILKSIDIQKSFLNVIYFETFNELKNF